MSKLQKQLQVTEYLDQNSIKYQTFNHKAVFTVEEAKEIDSKMQGAHTKNLFLKNEKSEEYYLVVILADKRANLKELAGLFGVKRLTFGKPNKLEEYLGLTPGSVSPFGLINDKEAKIKVLIDKEIYNSKSVNFHPNINTSTLNIKTKDFQKYLNSLSHTILEKTL